MGPLQSPAAHKRRPNENVNKRDRLLYTARDNYRKNARARVTALPGDSGRKF